MKKKSKQVKTAQTTNPPYMITLQQGERYTMEDSSTKLYIKGSHELSVIKVDDGIVMDKTVKKCDYLCAVDSEKCVHLIELKGTKINDAFLQLESTPEAIRQYSSHQTLLDGLNRLDAYIVSPLRQQVPNNFNEKKRRLCKELLKFCSVKPDKSMDLLKLVKVDPSCKAFVERDGQIQCSNKYPLEL